MADVGSSGGSDAFARGVDEEISAMVASEDPFSMMADPSSWGWELEADVENPPTTAIVVVAKDGRRVTATEASLLECYARDAEEQAEKRRQREARAAAAAARQQQRRAPETTTTTSTNSLTKNLGSDDGPKKKKHKKEQGEEEAGDAQLRKKKRVDTFAGASTLAKKAAPTTISSSAFSVPKRPKALVKKLEVPAIAAPPPAAAPVSQWEAVDLPRATAPLELGAELPAEGDVAAELPWRSETSDEALELALPGLGVNGGNQTLILRVSVSEKAEIWALNLAPEDHDDGATLLYHFNPRRVERGGQVVQNDKFDDDWGRATKTQTAKYAAPLFGLEEAEFCVQLQTVRGETVVVTAVDRKVIDCWTLRCKVPLKSGDNLALIVPTRDDFNNPESVLVHKAWWGHLPPIPIPPNTLNKNTNKPRH